MKVESLAAFAACSIAAVVLSSRLFRSDVVAGDALVHLYWMWNWKDAELFTDPLTADLRESVRYPDGYEALFWVASRCTDPIFFGELLGAALMGLSGWLVWAIVRAHSEWRPAAWIAAALFLALIEIHRFDGGFPRAFVHPVVLLTVLLAIGGHRRAAALVAAGGALFYPPAALLGVGVLLVASIRWADRRPRIERRHFALAMLALGLMAILVLLPAIVAGGSPRVMTRAEAKAFPEFGPDGPLHFFVPSTIEYLRQNRSGFDFREGGSILLLATLLLLLCRRGQPRLLKPEIVALPIVSLAAFALAQLLLFKLYLPHRYTYPLVAFFAIAVGVMLYPTWIALCALPRARLRAFAMVCAPTLIVGIVALEFPLASVRQERLASWTTAALALGSTSAAAALVFGAPRRIPASSVPAVGTVLTGLALFAWLLVVPHQSVRGSSCAERPVTRFIGTLPKDAVIAGDPEYLRCLPVSARRAVVISTKLAPAYEVDYFMKGRARMFATLRAYFGQSLRDIVALRTRYGATHLWLKRDAVEQEITSRGDLWRAERRPYGRFVRNTLQKGTPATLGLPKRCARWTNGVNTVYDIGCIARTLDEHRSTEPDGAKAGGTRRSSQRRRG